MWSDLASLLRSRGGPRSSRVLLVAAHPDDETLGAGVLLARLRDAHVLLMTDGAPLDRTWWGDPGQPSRESYAALRAAEFERAMARAGIGTERLHTLGFIDQQASLDLPGITFAIRDLIVRIRPGLILTHPYEGGHPDHDACAFAVRAAVRLLAGTDPGEIGTTSMPHTPRPARGDSPPVVAEFTSYHAAPDGCVAAGRFLDADPESVITLEPTEEERVLKREVLACYESQRSTLEGLVRDVERFRIAPAYDFTRPPHPGTLHYERYGWGMDGHTWRDLARSALAALGLRDLPSGEEATSRNRDRSCGIRARSLNTSPPMDGPGLLEEEAGPAGDEIDPVLGVTRSHRARSYRIRSRFRPPRSR